MKVQRESTLDPREDLTFAAWVAPHIGAMKSVARRHGAGNHSEDVVQEALIRAWRRRSTYQPERGTARAWLIAVTIDQRRRWSIRSRHNESVGLLEEPTVTAPDVGADLDLRQAIEQLTRRQREAVTWYYYVGFPVVEIAQLMDCSLGTVKSTLSDARRRLGSILGAGEMA